MLLDVARAGVGVVMLSTEVDEHLELMDRILVFREGEVAARSRVQTRRVDDWSRASSVRRRAMADGHSLTASPLGVPIHARLAAAWRENAYVFALLLAIILVIANIVAVPQFASWSQVPGELGTLAPFALAAMASTPAILVGGGGIDLSIAPLMGFSTSSSLSACFPTGSATPRLRSRFSSSSAASLARSMASSSPFSVTRP